ncbi:hypothetical protein TYRP_020529 [Tyrophagus putrescentiae]|nr:hypothetical protein TYRP_020529 [Tyrophagus putrescentiae]
MSGNDQRGRQLRKRFISEPPPKKASHPKKKETTTKDSSPAATEQPSAEQPFTEPPAARDSGNESLLNPSFAAPSSLSSANMGNNNNNNKQAVTAADILSSSAYLLLPDFIDKSPTAWVRLCKAQFIFLGITDEEAQYTRVLAGLPPKLVVDPVIEIIDSDFAQGHMDKLFAAIVDAFTTGDRHHHHPHPDHYQGWLPAANGSSDQLSSSAINSSLDGRIQELPKLNPTTSAERKHQSQPQAQAFSFNSELVNKLHHNSGVNNSVADAPSRAEAITSSPFTLNQLRDEQKKDLETLVVNGLLNFGLFEMQPSVRIIICKTEHKSSRHLAPGTLRRQVFDPGGRS